MDLNNRKMKMDLNNRKMKNHPPSSNNRKITNQPPSPVEIQEVKRV